MAMKKGLEVITERTSTLCRKVNEKNGEYVYNLAVDGNNKVVLLKGYTETIALGTAEVNRKLRDLLREEGRE